MSDDSGPLAILLSCTGVNITSEHQLTGIKLFVLEYFLRKKLGKKFERKNVKKF